MRTDSFCLLFDYTIKIVCLVLRAHDHNNVQFVGMSYSINIGVVSFSSSSSIALTYINILNFIFMT